MIIRASKVIIEVGTYDELPSEVVNLPDESEYRCGLADMVPAGELEHGGVCDKGVNTDPIRREMNLQKKVFKSQPESLVETVCVVHRLESGQHFWMKQS